MTTNTQDAQGQASVFGPNFKPRPGSRKVLHIEVGSMWILGESHDKECSCSYCQEGKLGLVLPANKGRNSWRSLRWKWFGKLQVLRWTLPNKS